MNTQNGTDLGTLPTSTEPRPAMTDEVRNLAERASIAGFAGKSPSPLFTTVRVVDETGRAHEFNDCTAKNYGGALIVESQRGIEAEFARFSSWQRVDRKANPNPHSEG